MELPLDHEQIKKAALALLAHNKKKQKTADQLLLNQHQNFFLMLTVWKIPSQERVIKIPLPHGILPATSDVCLFTKDEPGLTAEQTENLYKKLLTQHGITNVTEVISYKTLKTEYKPFEAKRRLLSRFALFLSDDRIRRLLPSHIGKHFYRSKKAPLSVNLKAKDLAKEINKHIQGTILPVTNKGCCYTVRVGHTGMEAWEISENITAVANVVATKASKIWNSVKILHLKTEKSVALPVFTWSHPKSNIVEKERDAKVEQNIEEQKKREKKIIKKKTTNKADEITESNSIPDIRRKKRVPAPAGMELEEEEEEDEEIPQLIPIKNSPNVKDEEVVEPNVSGEKAEPVPKESRTRRRKIFPSLDIPEAQLKIPKQRSILHTPKLLKKKSKGRVLEKKEVKTLPKAVKSPKRAPNTPKRKPKKMKVPEST